MTRTAKYILNLIHTSLEARLQRTKPTNIPVEIFYEPTELCNLGCPSCPTGMKLFAGETANGIENFQDIDKILGPYLMQWNIYNWGEPLMGKNTENMLEILSNKDYKVGISTNASTKWSEKTIEKLAISKNFRIRIDFDGITAEEIGRYRKGSDFSKILDNVERLSEVYKKQDRTRKSAIYMGFLRFKYNKKSEHALKEFAQQLGFAFHGFVALEYDDIMANAYDSEEVKSEKAKYINNFGCSWLYSTLCISPNLKRIQPCCSAWDNNLSVENFKIKDMLDIESGIESWRKNPLMGYRRLNSKINTERFGANILERNHDNCRKDKGMSLGQKEMDSDICINCKMVDSYQKHLNQLLLETKRGIITLWGKEKSENLFKNF